ncbi:MAG TPA: hypothetical protein VGM30_18820 [Puia sp.]
MHLTTHPYRPKHIVRRSLPVFLLLLLGVLAAGQGNAQTPGAEGTDRLTTRFDAYRSRALQEKLFVHTDKTFYLAGEVCWFKLYNVDGSTHKPLSLSKVAYVDVLDANNKFVLQGKIALGKGEGAGSFYLPLTLNSGNYKLRAYTNWMKNFGPDYFFEQTVTIINTLKSLPIRQPDTAAAYHISFFPEGGNLVKNVPSRIAFQLTGPDGKGLEGGGIIVDENRDTLASFHSFRYGIGSFFFTPPGDHVCTAILRTPDGQLLTKDLPQAYDKGMVMNVGEGKDGQIKVTVHSRGMGSGNIYLFAQTRLSPRLTRKTTLAQDSAIFSIDKTALGEGITQFTLFDDRMRPLCERLYFRRPSAPLVIDAVTDRQEYGTRKKVQIQLAAKEEGGAQLPASLSLSVYRVGTMQSSPETDIYNYLWLSSDLKGTIESPAEYLANSGPEADQALDNLMLTHGWRRFRWEDVLQDKEPSFPYPPEYTGHLISGRLTDMQTGRPVVERTGYLSVPGIEFGFQAGITDSAGRIFFDMKDFYGPGGIVIHSGEAADSPFKVEIFSPFSEQYSTRALPPLSQAFYPPVAPAASGAQQWLIDRSVGMQVQNIYSGDSMQRFRFPAIDTGRFYGHADYTYMLDDYTRFTTMEEVLREYVREINVNHMSGRLHVKMLDEPRRQFFEDNNDLVLLDGIPVPDDRIFAIDPLKIRRLEVIPRQYFLGPSVFNGIASFTTYKGDYDGLELDPHSLLIDYEGMQLQREFYSPVYATAEQTASPQPDFRELLYWAPRIHTDAQGNKAYDFYTSDLPGKYVAVVQGIDDNGTAGTKYVYFEVK